MPSGTTLTPNIGLQIPGFDQGNWQVPTNYNWNLLDQIFGGEVQVPALNVLNLIIGNIATSLMAAFVAEVPSGAVPGNTYTLSQSLGLLMGVYVNGLLQTDYTVSGNVVTLGFSTSSGDTVYALYFKTA